MKVKQSNDFVQDIFMPDSLNTTFKDSLGIKGWTLDFPTGLQTHYSDANYSDFEIEDAMKVARGFIAARFVR